MKEWNGIMTVLELRHIAENGELIHRECDVRNMIHKKGQEYILEVLFAGRSKPSSYYVGLDNRSLIVSTATIASVGGYEPTTNGYVRQAILSDSLQVEELSGVIQARSPVLVFRASGGSWGPIKNIFLSTALGYDPLSSTLVSSAALSREITVNDGEIITMRMAMSLTNCADCPG